MTLRHELIRVLTPALRALYAAFPFPGIVRPVFILGCGRSGTTILGTALSRHRNVSYLNEPRHLWASAYPETDIWGDGAKSRDGQLFLSGANTDPKRSRKLKRLFRFEALRNRQPVLIEKLPVNNFRLKFVHEIFPDARFIHIYRNGLEVARSIERMSNEGRWFGPHFYKWDKLVDYATHRDETKALPLLCTTDFLKGLLEWRLSTEAAVSHLRDLREDAFIEFSYEFFVDHPIEAIRQVLDFIGIDHDQEVERFVAEKVGRQSSKLPRAELTREMKMLGGDLLPLSMDGGAGLVRRLPPQPR